MVRKLAVILFWLLILSSQISYADTHTSASCSQSDVQTAITASETGDTVSIAAGSCTWTGAITVNKNIIVDGGGTIGSWDSAAQITSSGVVFTLSEVGEGFRLTGIKFTSSGDNGITILGGSGWRIDNCQFNNTAGVSKVSINIGSANVSSTPAGLIDNNDFVEGRIVVNRSSNLAEAHALWAATHPFGSADTTGLGSVYIEDNRFHKTVSSGGNVIDAGMYGVGSYVARYNTVTGTTQFHGHYFGTDTNRPPNAWEVYGNSFVASSATWTPIYFRAGTGFIFNNAITNYSYGIVFDNVRRTTSIGSAGICNGNSQWDENRIAAGQTGAGYPCSDQIGRGADTSLWSVGSPHVQTDQPAYLWGNLKGGVSQSPYVSTGDSAYIAANRDYYTQAASFNGTSGTGCGALANRPATCTTGVAYWATTQSCSDLSGMVGQNPATPISGTLYKCTATNTWTSYYTPYTYPHPLRNETPGESYYIINNSVAGSGCSWSEDNASVAPNETKALTLTVQDGYKLTGLSGDLAASTCTEGTCAGHASAYHVTTPSVTGNAKTLVATCEQRKFILIKP